MTASDAIRYVTLSTPQSVKRSVLGDERSLRTLHSYAVFGITGSAALCLAGTIMGSPFSMSALMAPLLLALAGGALASLVRYWRDADAGVPPSPDAHPADPTIELHGRNAQRNSVLRKVSENETTDTVFRTVLPRGMIDCLFGLQIVSIVIGVSLLSAPAHLICVVLIAEVTACLLPSIVTFKRYRVGGGLLLVEHVCQLRPRVVQKLQLHDARVRADLDGGFAYVWGAGESTCVDLATLWRPTDFVARLVREWISARTDGMAGR